jgi:tRNA threonylcarbamoyladenosine biosynthesis protein TsaB
MSRPDASPWQKILVLNTTSADTTAVGWFADQNLTELNQSVRAQELQKLIEQLLQQVDATHQDIDAVAVLTGPGSYTGTRIGIATANTIGWLLGKPIIELPADDFGTAVALLNQPDQLKAKAAVTAVI